jgi:hypothetical protein
VKPGTKTKLYTSFAIAREYEWRDKQGEFHKIEDMETRHLFHVVRMVWDHSVPEEWQTSFRTRYHFPEFYTELYMALTIRLMLPALLVRSDLTPEMWYWLSYMRQCLLDDRLSIPFMQKIGYEHGCEDEVS